MGDQAEVCDAEVEYVQSSTTIRLGIVCVHGIGRQVPGQTAAEVLGAVEAGVTQLGGEFVRLPTNAGDGHGAALRASMTLPESECYEVEFHDGWWDERVLSPKPGVVLGWVWRIFPFALWSTVALWAFDLASLSVSASRRQDLLSMLLTLLLAFGVIVAAPFIALALAMVSAASLVPSLSRRIVDVLSLRIGDAWLYRSDSLDESVIAEITSLVERVADDSDVTLLVGHSQGAEIGRRVALGGRVHGCVWVGSGESQLGMLRTFRRSRWVPPVLWSMIIAWPAAFAFYLSVSIEGLQKLLGPVAIAWQDLTAAGAIVSTESLKEMSNAIFRHSLYELVVQVGFLALLLVGFVLLSRLSTSPPDMHEQPECEVMAVKSLIDPVCFGPNKDGAAVRYVPVERPYHLEHVRYFEKPATGVAILEAILGSEAADFERHEPYVQRWVFGLALGAAFALVVLTAWIGNVEISLVSKIF